MKTSRLGLFALAIALYGCGDDSGSNEGSTTSSGSAADSGTGSTSPSTSAGTGETSSAATHDTTDVGTDGTSGSSTGEATDSTGSTGSRETATTEGSGSESGSGSADSTSTGGVVQGCEACDQDEVCVENQAFETTYECHAKPQGCAGDVDCRCGAALCQDPFVACNDLPEPNHLACICIAC